MKYEWQSKYEGTGIVLVDIGTGEYYDVVNEHLLEVATSPDQDIEYHIEAKDPPLVPDSVTSHTSFAVTTLVLQ